MIKRFCGFKCVLSCKDYGDPENNFCFITHDILRIKHGNGCLGFFGWMVITDSGHVKSPRYTEVNERDNRLTIK